MAPRKRQTTHAKTHRSNAKRELSATPDPYQSLVAEYLAAEVSSPAETENEDTRSAKRRRVNESDTENENLIHFENEDNPRSPSKQQYAYNDSDDEVTDEYSDADFEDVVLSDAPHTATRSNPPGDLHLTLGGKDVEPQKRLSAGRRKALTAADRKMRLEIHKTHILALLSHGRLRNQWCNDSKVQAALRGLLPPSIRKMFKDDATQSQWQRSRSLKMGLEKTVEVFKDQFQTSARGTARCYWSESPSVEQIDVVPKDIDLPIEKEDFQTLAIKRKASRDVGAQLFCALLRSVGLDVRLVCSLQPLPIRATFRPATLNRPAPVIVPFRDNQPGMLQEQSKTESSMEVRDGADSIPQGIRRFGHTTKKVYSTPTKGMVASGCYDSSPTKHRIHESSFPIYWVEVFNIADQKWIPVDPLVLKVVDKPSKYEPPANDAENSMSYVLAIDEDCYVKDVTRRYTHAYNAKTRLNRVESSKDGHEWWERIMRVLRDPLPQDRDQVEDSELSAKEAREPMPRNIVEFKNHPHYALERHLRQNEVLQPKRQVGTISSGSNKNVEAVYRRKDVHTVRSADAWFRKGQQVKLNEMPLKYLEPKKPQGHRTRDDEPDEEETEISHTHAGTPLFAAYQTEQYTPPPVLNRIIPKNMYGNIDVYIAWMVPAGGVWINHPFACGAAKLLSLDWADAVTGFEFRGRTGTAIIKGAVVASEYHEAITETIKALQYAIEEEELHRRSIQILQTWKRFLIALRIRQRIKNYHVEGEELEAAAAARQQSDSEYNEDDESGDNSETNGGFLREAQSDTDIPMPIAPLHAIQQDTGEPFSKALQDAMAPILSTWGEPLPTITNNPITSFQTYNSYLESTELSGGFFPEYTSGEFIIPNPSEIEENSGSSGGGGFIPPTPSQDSQDSQKDLQSEEQNPQTTDEANQTSNTAQINMEVENSNTTTHITQLQPVLIRTESSAALSTKTTSSGRSVGSLLSHDPDDDDVEPEWI